MHPIIGRIAQLLITLFTSITLGFVLIHQLPTGPWEILLAMYSEATLESMDGEQIQQLASTIIGFDATAPIHQQYIEFITNYAQGDFGQSVIFQRRNVFDVIAVAVPWTVFMTTIAMVANTVIGVSAGAYMAYREGSRFDVGGTAVSVLLSSIPYYVFAILLLAFLGHQTEFFPASDRFSTEVTVGFNLDFFISALRHVALPAISLIFTSFAALSLRAHSIRVLGSDYIRVARLRGLSERRIVFHYLLRNSILPYYTGFVTGLVGLFGGAVITESIFQYLGVGYYLFTGAVGGDIPLVIGSFVLFTVATIIMLMVVDMTYHFIDPRAEGVGTSESF